MPISDDSLLLRTHMDQNGNSPTRLPTSPHNWDTRKTLTSLSVAIGDVI
jgi:hypothetical protein